MPRFKVRCYVAGVWDEVAPVEIEASDEKAAAESVCGCPLVAGDHGERLRAAVWPPRTFEEPAFFSILIDGAAKRWT